MGHITHHSGTPDEVRELTLATLSSHVQWPSARDRGVLLLTETGKRDIKEFIMTNGV